MSNRKMVKNTTILDSLKLKKISDLQLDPFGFCNAKCWFCPVRYKKNPTETMKHMPIELMDKIFNEIVVEKTKPNGLVSKNFSHFYTAHYNEVLLYKHFEEMLFLAECYGFKTMVLSNGINLTKEKTDIIKKHINAISGINLNIPAFEEDLWRDRSGIKIGSFEKLINNIKYAEKNLQSLVSSGAFSIGLNIPTKYAQYDNSGWIDFLEDAPKIDLSEKGEGFQQVKKAKEIFPNMNIHHVNSLVDRAGILKEYNVIDNSRVIQKYKGKRTKVIDCTNGDNGRIYGWLHVNSIGEAFLCCNDYDFEYTFGNFNNQSLEQIWLSQEHISVIEKALSTICTRCVSAKWE